MNNICDIVGDLSIKAIPLNELGIFEYAWEYNDLLSVLELLRKDKITLLGGDVYRLSGKKIFITYDSWYYSSKDKSNYEDSYNKALEFINIFEAKKEKYIYSIII